MEYLWYGIFFILGSIIGSFLNVVLYRFHTGRSLGGRSHCPTCGKLLSWYELLPLFSFLMQRGACRGCLARISSRYFIVELLTGLLFMLAWHLFSWSPFLLAFYLVLLSVLVLIVAYDMRHTIIPDEFTVVVGVLSLLYAGSEAAGEGDWRVLLLRLAAGLIAALFFFGLWRFSHGRWIGFGDVKLALPLGVMVGLGSVFSMVVLSFWIGAVISLLILGVGRLGRRGKTGLHFMSAPLTMKSEVPFAPFLVAGFLIVQFFHADIFDITYRLFFA